jgi:hypothetical protein
MLLDIYHCGGEFGREFGLFVVYVEGSGPTELNHLYSMLQTIQKSRVSAGDHVIRGSSVNLKLQAWR